MTDRPHLLLTNDDGVDREGLQALRRELIARGSRVTVVAPAENQSGMGKSVTCRQAVTVEAIEKAGPDRVFACHGTPVDCVRVALLSDLVEQVDLVVSGINHGVNLGDDASFSGTLGAALEGAMLGVPAVAFSQQDNIGDSSLVSHGGHTFSLAPFAAALAGSLAARPLALGRVALNVNFPHELKTTDVRLTRLSNFTYAKRWGPSEQISPGKWSVWSYTDPAQPDPAMETAPDTDAGAIADGAISIAPVLAEWAAGNRVDLDSDELERIADLSATTLASVYREDGGALAGRLDA